MWACFFGQRPTYGWLAAEGFAIDARVIEADARRARRVQGKLTVAPDDGDAHLATPMPDPDPTRNALSLQHRSRRLLG